MSDVYPKLTLKRPQPPPEVEENEDFVINVLPPEEVVKPEMIEEVVENRVTYSPKEALKKRLVRKPKLIEDVDFNYSPVFINNPFKKLLDFLTFKPSYRLNSDITYAPDYYSMIDETYSPAYATKQIYKPKTLQKRTLIYDPKLSRDYNFDRDYYLQPLVVDEIIPNANTDVLKYAPEEEIKISPETVFEVNVKPPPPQFINTIYYKLMGRLFNA